MKIGWLWCLFVVARVSAEKWSWPEGAASVRIDTKVRFVDATEDNAKDKDKQNLSVRPVQAQSDDIPFREPEDTDGFYNRPPGAGRYPIRVEQHRSADYRVTGSSIFPGNNQESTSFPYDGTLDSLQFCKCVANPDCVPNRNSRHACGDGKFLCCYKRPNSVSTTHNNEFFNEVEDERPILLPGRENLARPFPPPPSSSLNNNGYFGAFGPGQGHDTSVVGVFDKHPAVLVGPNGPTGSIGPQHKNQVLVGPGGPTGNIGPVPNKADDGRRSESAQRGVLVGPGGPTGVIGPYGRRPVLVGPGGPTGIIGPARGPRGPGLLVGPGGPTGIIGPSYNRQQGPGILTGPGGPTGSIGPGRQILVGPGGPTGLIGPQSYFGK